MKTVINWPTKNIEKQTLSRGFAACDAIMALLLLPIGIPMLSWCPCQLDEIGFDVPVEFVTVVAGLIDLGGNSGGTPWRDEGTLFLLLLRWPLLFSRVDEDCGLRWPPRAKVT